MAVDLVLEAPISFSVRTRHTTDLQGRPIRKNEVRPDDEFLVGTEAAVATSIQPYRSELSRGEMARVHNLAWRRRQTKESDMDCFVAIFSSTLFVSWYEARAVDIYGDEVLCPFLIRQATGDRDYDVVAYGFTKFAENATSRRLPARASSFLDLKLGPPVSATDDEAADGEPTLGPGETRTSA